LDELIGQVVANTPNVDPLARLVHSTLSGARMNELADHLVGHFVELARRDGATWTAVGQALGVSKQAAQQRFGGKDGEPLVTDAQAFQRFAPDTRRAVAAAGNAAQAAANDHLGTEHLILGLVSNLADPAARLIAALGMPAEAFQDLARSYLPPSREEDGERSHAVPITPSAKRVLGTLAVREMLRHGADSISSVHLLLAILSDIDGIGASVLTGCGITKDKVDALLANPGEETSG
jgi:hypothetical protein